MFIRYIKDWLNGNSINTEDHWVEIEIIDINRINRALNILPSTDSSILGNGAYATNGIITASDLSGFTDIGSGLHYLKIDLGLVYNIKYIKIWHFYNDGRIYYNTKTEVSGNDNDYTTIFDSAVSGTYNETSDGKTYILPLTKFLIQDGNNLDNTDGNALSVQNTIPYTVNKFNSYGMDVLSNINSTVINKIINQNYRIGLLK